MPKNSGGLVALSRKILSLKRSEETYEVAYLALESVSTPTMS
jgi:hypothetical protein